VSTFGTARTKPITFPRRAGRPANGHKAGTRPAETRVNSGRRTRRVAGQAPHVRPIAPDQALLDVRQAALVLGLSPWTIRDMVDSGRLPKAEIPGVRRVLIPRAAVDRLARPAA
jgi:excisionase family DNA binding protein